MPSWTEDERLRAVRREGVLDTPAEAGFDQIVEAAARACGVPIAAISLIDEHRQWFKAKLGLAAGETSRDVAFCAHTILGDEVMVVADATGDQRFAANPLVTDDPSIRFYAGAPIRNEDGVPLGALCVIDTSARPDGLSDDQAHMLRVLAEQVSSQLRLRRMVNEQARLARSQTENLVRVLDSGAVGWWDWDVTADKVVGNAELAKAFGLDPALAAEGVSIDAFFANVHPGDRAALAERVTEAVRTGLPFEDEYQVTGADGAVRWVLARGRCLRDDRGRPTRFPGVIINIDDRKRAERMLREADTGREMAMQAARLGRWDHAPSENKRYYDARAREMFGLGPDDSVALDLVFTHIHPDDRARVADAALVALDPERHGPFREAFRIVDAETGEVRWINATGRTQFTDGVCTRFMGVLDDITAAKRAEEHRLLLTNELRHRVKNTLALVVSIVDASLREAPDLTTGRKTANERLVALSQAHDMLTDANWSAATVPAVIEGVAASLSLPRDRLRVDSAPVRLGPRPALQLTLALHELATNSIKYGALSNGTGQVRMTCRVAPSDDGAADFRFEWRETGGPPVTPPTRTGFGARLIERATAGEFRGTSKIDYAPDGVRWSLAAPYEGLAERGQMET